MTAAQEQAKKRRRETRIAEKFQLEMLGVKEVNADAEKQDSGYKYVFVLPNEILVDDRYQRGVNEGRVARIAKKFDENLVNPPKVSLRNEKYYVFDGQHTLAVWRIIKGNTPILCKVYSGLSFNEEVHLFTEQNGESAAVRTGEKLRARYAAGDEDVSNMVQSVENNGLCIGWDGGRACEKKILAVRSLWKAYRLIGKDRLTDMLTVIVGAWGGETDSLRGEILNGMARFWSVYDGQFDSKALTHRLSPVPPMSIIRDGRKQLTGVQGGTAYARVILALYNKGRRGKKLEDSF